MLSCCCCSDGCAIVAAVRVGATGDATATVWVGATATAVWVGAAGGHDD